MSDKKEKQYVSDNAQLMSEWNWERNEDISPEQLTLGSHVKVWWVCNKGHEWQTEIKNKNKGGGCPYCAGYFAIKGENDLQTVNTALANEWNYEKNVGLTPIDVLPNSRKKVWWICNKGHEWQARIYSRNRGSGCPTCSIERNTSFPEYMILYYLREYGLEPMHSYKEHGYELDIYIPSKKIGIEYDGYFWHKDKVKQDLEKNKWCKEQGIALYRIREGLMPLNDSSIDYVIQRNQHGLPETIESILDGILGTKITVDLGRDALKIENLREYTEKKNSIMILDSELVSEWNYEKNGRLTPENFSINSHKRVWWKCKEGHEWLATIGNRSKGDGCPYCSGRVATKGENDLKTVNPALAKDWNYERNVGLTPMDVLPNSGKKVWWKCSEEHEWKARIADRNKGRGCPYCSGKRLIKGHSDLQTINSSVAKEWNYEKNNGIHPDDVMPNSQKKMWWKCSNGHEWLASINNRNKGNGCPYCSGRRVLKGYNDLQTINPSLAIEWNYEKNGELKPESFTANSNESVWWKCGKGHEWKARIAHRNKGSGCPECAKDRCNRKIE